MAVTLSITKAVELVKDGYVRWTKDEITAEKSLQSYFKLNTQQMKALLARPELKNKRTTDNTLVFVEDLPQEIIIVEEVVETVDLNNGEIEETVVETISESSIFS